MRIAFSIDNLQVGGTELNAIRTVERLDRARFDVRLVTLAEDGPMLARYRAAGVPVHHFPLRNLYTPHTLRQAARLRALLRAERVDLLHAHDLYSNIFAAPVARVAGCAVVSSRRWWEGAPRPALRRLHAFSYRAAHRVLVNSEALVGLVHAEDGVPAERIGVVRNFLDAEAFEPPGDDVRRQFRAELGIPAGAPCIGVVASIYPIKGHATLIRALPALRERWHELRAVFVGRDAGAVAELRELAHGLGVGDAVIFAGYRTNLPNLHFHFEVSVLPSLSEGMPNSVLEAMAAGRPVVSSRVGGVADAITDGEHGLLVPPGDTEALAHALTRVLEDAHYAQRLGEVARERARERYAPERALRDLEALYGRALAASGKGSLLETPGRAQAL